LKAASCLRAVNHPDPLWGKCDAVLFLTVFPIPLHNLPAYLGDVAYLFALTMTLYLLVRKVATAGRQGKQLHAADAFLEISSCLLPWVACPFRFFESQLWAHKILLGVSSALGWMRFLQVRCAAGVGLGSECRACVMSGGRSVERWRDWTARVEGERGRRAL
jgi:hypothetical protein